MRHLEVKRLAGVIAATVVPLLVQAADVGFAFVSSHSNSIYRLGEMAEVRVSLTNGCGRMVTDGRCRVVMDNFGDRVIGSSVEFDLAKTNPIVLRGSLDRPGFLRFVIDGEDGAGRPFHGLWAVGFEPERIRPGSERPADFDAFWDSAVANFAATVPFDVQMVRNEAQSVGSHDCYELTFPTVPAGRKIRGQLSVPKEKGRFPITMNVPGAGSGTWSWARLSGRCYLTLNVVDYPHRPSGDVDALYADQNARWSAKSGLTGDVWYFVGDLSREREDYFYYGAILGINRAVDWVAGLDKVDTSDFRYEGQSQGGAFGIILSALNTHITRAQIAEPALTDLSGELVDGRQSGWPQLISRTKGYTALNENVKRIAPYYDCAHFVPRITIPTRWNVGFVDELCPPTAVWAGYNCLRTYDKMMSCFPGLGHGIPAAKYQEAARETEATWEVEVLPPKDAPWIDAKVEAYPEGPLTARTVETVRGWGNWVGTDFANKAAVAQSGSLEISTSGGDSLDYRGTRANDLSSSKVKGVRVCTSFARFPSYRCGVGHLEVPVGAKAALTICNGDFYGLAAKGNVNAWTLLAPAGAFAGAEVAVRIEIENYADGDASVRYLVGATPETATQIGDVLYVKSDADVSAVSFEGSGTLTRLEGESEEWNDGLMLLIAGS